MSSAKSTQQLPHSKQHPSGRICGRPWFVDNRGLVVRKRQSRQRKQARDPPIKINPNRFPVNSLLNLISQPMSVTTPNFCFNIDGPRPPVSSTPDAIEVAATAATAAVVSTAATAAASAHSSIQHREERQLGVLLLWLATTFVACQAVKVSYTVDIKHTWESCFLGLRLNEFLVLYIEELMIIRSLRHYFLIGCAVIVAVLKFHRQFCDCSEGGGGIRSILVVCFSMKPNGVDSLAEFAC
jgi:hypothetical protein